MQARRAHHSAGRPDPAGDHSREDRKWFVAWAGVAGLEPSLGRVVPVHPLGPREIFDLGQVGVPVMPAAEGIDRSWPESCRPTAWQQPRLHGTDPRPSAFR